MKQTYVSKIKQQDELIEELKLEIHELKTENRTLRQENRTLWQQNQTMSTQLQGEGFHIIQRDQDEETERSNSPTGGRSPTVKTISAGYE